MQLKNIFLSVLVFILSFSLAVMANPVDIKGHRAEKSILSLLEDGLMSPWLDGLFHPEESITRADLQSLALIRDLKLTQRTDIPDLREHLAAPLLGSLVKEGYVALFPDGTYRPSEQVTRGEMASILIRFLKLDEPERIVNTNGLTVPSDMSNDHWALEAVKITNRLGLTSSYGDNSYRPNQNLTRAEFAETLYQLKDYKTATSFLQEIYPTSRKIALESLDDKQKVITINNNALLGRNNRIVTLDELKRSDKVYLLFNEKEEIVYLKAYGLMSKDDVTTEISYLSDGRLSSGDINSLLDGNYDVLKPVLSSELTEQLGKQGFSDNEISSLLAQDWNSLEDLGKERLSEVLSMETSLPLDITRALVKKDWKSAQELTKMEIMQRVLQHIMDLNIFQS